MPGNNSGAMRVVHADTVAEVAEVTKIEDTVARMPAEARDAELRAIQPQIIDQLFQPDDITNALMGASSDEALNVARINIKRIQVPLRDADGNQRTDAEGKPLTGPFSFRVRALRMDDYRDAERMALVPVRSQQYGSMVIRKEVDETQRMVHLIWRAIVPEDRPPFEDKRLWDKYAAGNAIECMSRVLLIGEQMTTLATVYQISGFENEEDLLGNSSRRGAS